MAADAVALIVNDSPNAVENEHPARIEDVHSVVVIVAERLQALVLNRAFEQLSIALHPEADTRSFMVVKPRARKHDRHMQTLCASPRPA
jgi:hypothetical protein